MAGEVREPAAFAEPVVLADIEAPKEPGKPAVQQEEVLALKEAQVAQRAFPLGAALERHTRLDSSTVAAVVSS